MVVNVTILPLALRDSVFQPWLSTNLRLPHRLPFSNQVRERPVTFKYAIKVSPFISVSDDLNLGRLRRL